MSNEMNNMPVKDSKGNVTGMSNLDGDDLLSALLTTMSVQSPNTGGKNFLYGKQVGMPNVAPKSSLELSRWLKQNYPTGFKNLNLNKLNEHTKVLQNFKNLPKTGIRNIPLKIPKRVAPGPLGALISLLATAPTLVEKGRSLSDYLLGLNETEIWENPDKYGTGESYDPSMDPNRPESFNPIKDMIKPMY